MHKTIKRTPKGPWIMFKSLKTSTNRMRNEERLWSQFGSDLASFSLLSLQSFTFGPQNLPFSPFFTLIYRKIRHLGSWQLAQVSFCFILKQPCSRPGELSSSRKDDYFTMKLFGGLGGPEASLGELGFRKSLKMTFLPSPLGIFASLIKTLNDRLFRTVIGI